MWQDDTLRAFAEHTMEMMKNQALKHVGEVVPPVIIAFTEDDKIQLIGLEDTEVAPEAMKWARKELPSTVEAFLFGYDGYITKFLADTECPSCLGEYPEKAECEECRGTGWQMAPEGKQDCLRVLITRPKHNDVLYMLTYTVLKEKVFFDTPEWSTMEAEQVLYSRYREVWA